MTREAVLARTLVELADTLVDDFDVVDLLTRLAGCCVEVLDVDAAGIMLAAPDGDLRVMASSNEAMRVLELFEIQIQEGPCLDAHRTGLPVVNQDLTAVKDRWPRRGRGPGGRIPLRPRAAHAVAPLGHRCPQPLPDRLRRDGLGRRRGRAGVR